MEPTELSVVDLGECSTAAFTQIDSIIMRLMLAGGWFEVREGFLRGRQPTGVDRWSHWCWRKQSRNKWKKRWTWQGEESGSGSTFPCEDLGIAMTYVGIIYIMRWRQSAVLYVDVSIFGICEGRPERWSRLDGVESWLEVRMRGGFVETGVDVVRQSWGWHDENSRWNKIQ